MCLQKQRVRSNSESKLILQFGVYNIQPRQRGEKMRVDASKLLSPLNTNVHMTQSKIQKEQMTKNLSKGNE